MSHSSSYTPKILYEKKFLHNVLDSKSLKQRLSEEKTKRITLSFYSYTPIEHLHEFRDQFYRNLRDIKALGRIYIATEGINAQMSIPTSQYKALQQIIQTHFPTATINPALNDHCSFIKLIVKVKSHIVADGLKHYKKKNHKPNSKHVNADTWNTLLEQPDTVVVDIRNRYEHEVGHFQGALRMPTDTFRDQMQKLPQTLEPYKKQKLLLYCTGGIRCEKASAHLMDHGFHNIVQLKGGIIGYTQQVKQQSLDNHYIGKNFVFDQRLSESVTKHVLGTCYTCGAACDYHLNCAWMGCHVLFIQCENCRSSMSSCCSKECQEKHHLPNEKQKHLLKESHGAHKRYKSRAPLKTHPPHKHLCERQ